MRFRQIGLSRLPGDIHLQKPIQIILVGLAIPEQFHITGRFSEKLAGKDGEIQIGAIAHHFDALLKTVRREQIVGIEEDHKLAARFCDAEIPGGGSAGFVGQAERNRMRGSAARRRLHLLSRRVIGMIVDDDRLPIGDRSAHELNRASVEAGPRDPVWG